MSEGKRKWIVQFVSFNLVGLVNTAVDYIVFQALVWAGMFYIGAQVISYGAGMVNSYLMNRRITFRGTQAGVQSRARIVRFVVLNVAVLLCTMLLLYLFVDLGGLPYWLSKLLLTGVTLVLNFAGSKLWVFRDEHAEAPRQHG